MRIPAIVLVLFISATAACAGPADPAGPTDPTSPTAPTAATDPAAPTDPNNEVTPTDPIEPVVPPSPTGEYTKHCTDCESKGTEFCCSCGPDGARKESCVAGSCSEADVDDDSLLRCTVDDVVTEGDTPAGDLDESKPTTAPADGDPADVAPAELPLAVDVAPTADGSDEDIPDSPQCKTNDDCLGGFCVEVGGSSTCQTGEEGAPCNKKADCKKGSCEGTPKTCQ